MLAIKVLRLSKRLFVKVHPLSLVFGNLFLGSMVVFALGCKRGENVQAAPIAKIHVETIEATNKRVPTSLPVTGALEALVETDLAANTTGKIRETYVNLGEEVKKGHILAQMDVKTTRLQAQAAKTQAQVASDQAALQSQECARLEKLVSSGASTKAEQERQQWQCKVAKGTSAVSTYQAAVSAQMVQDGTIRAPFDGSIVARYVEPGGYVVPSTKVVRFVSSLKTLKLRISVPEIYLAKLKKGLPLSFHVVSYPNETFVATLVRISPVVNSSTRDIIAEAEVENPNLRLHPGQFATVDLLVAEAELPVVPKEAIVEKEGNVHLFVVGASQRIEERVVRTSASLSDGSIAIAKGLAAGERVVRKPGSETKNGLLVD